MPSNTGNRRTNIPDNRIKKYAKKWCFTALGRLMYLRIPEGESLVKRTFRQPEVGDTILLQIPTITGNIIHLDLTHLTVPELEMVAEVIKDALSEARPICARRDEYAATFEPGPDEDYLERRFRQLPGLFTPQGNVR